MVQSLWRGLHWAGPNLKQTMRMVVVFILSRMQTPHWYKEVGDWCSVMFENSDSTRSTGRKSFARPKLLCAGCHWQAAKLSRPAQIRGRRGQVSGWFFGNTCAYCILQELSGGGVWASRFSQKSRVTHDDSINMDSFAKRQPYPAKTSRVFRLMGILLLHYSLDVLGLVCKETCSIM